MEVEEVDFFECNNGINVCFIEAGRLSGLKVVLGISMGDTRHKAVVLNPEQLVTINRINRQLSWPRYGPLIQSRPS